MAIGNQQSNSRHSIVSSKNIARIYKCFFERFQTEYTSFLTHIDGIADNDDLNKYASLMLTRLMFLYFLQHKNFFDDDPNYLANHLKMFQNHGETTNLNFYHDFLLTLFFQGLSNPIHPPELSVIIGNVPFLNIDLFKRNQIESNNSSIQISDAAFEPLFTFLDTYCWQMSGSLHHNETEITPDIFGYIFERRINQKQMGAFYTQDDITKFIAETTIIPFLFNTIEKKYPDLFQGDRSIWQLLRDNPVRYIYLAIQKGVEVPLPTEIEEGLYDVSRREHWNRLASDLYALPTETWREVIARRQHFQQIRTKLESDTVRCIDELVFYNLDICLFAQDVVERCENHDLLQAFYESISKLTVLDPTCGSGAFLFAVLDILEPLYTVCLDRLEQLNSINSSDEGKSRQGDYQHSNRQYSLLKSIITSNLYGVDIMKEASEICKLRLFLKLLTPIERPEEIEPLPDLASNIRSGNTLLGSTYQLEVPTCSGGAYFRQEPFISPEDQPFHWFIEFNTIMQNGGIRRNYWQSAVC